MLTAATMFSGIGAPEVAMPGWRWAWHAEIEKFPSAVMAARHPGSTNLGDVSAHDFVDRAAAIARPDVLVFGSPCQSFSIAGKRLGLDDPRGNLALVALGIVGRLKPTWFVFENVPGLLSLDDGSAFGLFLRTVDELGYFGAWSVLDAQFRGVAQRRQRVFFVGHSRDWRGPAAVLLEPESLCGHPPARQQARQDVAGAIGAGSERSGGRVGRREAAANHLIAGALPASIGGPDDNDAADGRLVTGTLTANGKAAGSATQQDAENGMLVAFGGNRTGGPIDVAPALQRGDPTGRQDFESETFIAHAFDARQSDAIQYGDMTGPLDTDGHSMAVAFDPTQITSRDNRSQPAPGKPCHALAADAKPPAIAFSCKDNGTDASELAPTLRAMNHSASHANAGGQVAVAVALRGREGGATAELSDVPAVLRTDVGGPPPDAARMRAAAGLSGRLHADSRAREARRRRAALQGLGQLHGRAGHSFRARADPDRRGLQRMKHRWGAPDRLQFKTERECARCGLVKVTRHEPGVLPWVEFWRACERVPGDRTPPCASEAQPTA